MHQERSHLPQYGIWEKFSTGPDHPESRADISNGCGNGTQRSNEIDPDSGQKHCGKNEQRHIQGKKAEDASNDLFGNRLTPDFDVRNRPGMDQAEKLLDNNTCSKA
jgi:hypothetical protein